MRIHDEVTVRLIEAAVIILTMFALVGILLA